MADPFVAAGTYYKFKQTINSKDGSAVEDYALNSAKINSLSDTCLIAQNISYLRGLLLANGAAVVEGVVSLETVTANSAEGLQLSSFNLGKPTLLYAADDVTPETEVEAYKDPRMGLILEFPTAQGRRGKHLLRFLRASWIVDNQSVIAGVAPIDPSLLDAAISALGTPPHLGTLLSCFGSYIRDNTQLVRKVSGALQVAGFSNGAMDWAITGVGQRELGYGWPKIRGRQPAYA